MDYERWRIHQRRYVAPDYEPARSWPEDELVELSEALARRGWYLVDAAARNALIRKRDRRLVVLDGALITGTQLRFRVACARVLDAAAALFCSSFPRGGPALRRPGPRRARAAGALRRWIGRRPTPRPARP